MVALVTLLTVCSPVMAPDDLAAMPSEGEPFDLIGARGLHLAPAEPRVDGFGVGHSLPSR